MANNSIEEEMAYPIDLPRRDNEEDLTAMSMKKKNPVRKINLLPQRTPSVNWVLIKVSTEITNIQMKPLSFFQMLRMAFMVVE